MQLVSASTRELAFDREDLTKLEIGMVKPEAKRPSELDFEFYMKVFENIGNELDKIADHALRGAMLAYPNEFVPDTELWRKWHNLIAKQEETLDKFDRKFGLDTNKR